MEERVGPAIPSDGFLRLPLDVVLGVSMVHLMSGADADESPRVRRCGSATLITGYTEWGSKAVRLSLGWDWQLCRTDEGEVTCIRLGLPRTNVMLIDAGRRDYGWKRNLAVLARVVDTLPWAEQVRRALQGD